MAPKGSGEAPGTDNHGPCWNAERGPLPDWHPDDYPRAIKVAIKRPDGREKMFWVLPETTLGQIPQMFRPGRMPPGVPLYCVANVDHSQDDVGLLQHFTMGALQQRLGTERQLVLCLTPGPPMHPQAVAASVLPTKSELASQASE